MSCFCHPSGNYFRPLDIALFICILRNGRGWETKHFTLASAKHFCSSKSNGILGCFQQLSTPAFLISFAEPVCMVLALAGSFQPRPGFGPPGGGQVTLGCLCCCLHGATGTPKPCPCSAGGAIVLEAHSAHLQALRAYSHLWWCCAGHRF